MFGDKKGLKGQYCKSYATLKFHRTVTDNNWISTGDVTHKFRTNRMVTDSECSPNGRLCPFCEVESFEHAQNFPPDGTDINGHHRTRNGFTGLETDIKRIRPDAKG